jgi:hypothetical protein
VDRYRRLREIAASKKLSLSRPAERKHAESLLFEEMGSATVARSKTWDEAMAAAMRRLGAKPGVLAFSEADRTANAVREKQAALLVLEERPELCAEYGTPRGEPDDSQAKFERALSEELRRRNEPATPTNRTAAARHLIAMGQRVPSAYGYRS